MTTVIVSAYFKIPSKQPHSWYKPHLENFLRNVNQICYFYTSQDVRNEFLFNNPCVNYIITEFPETDFNDNFWERQITNDPEKYHTVPLIKLWYLKKEFILKTINLINADYYIWCDAGCVRDEISIKALKDFGNRNYLNGDKLYVQQIAKVPTKQYYKYLTISIAGAIMAGSKTAWENYKAVYDRILTEYDKNNVTGSSDQLITLSCIDMSPEYFEVCRCHKNGIDNWFFFLYLI